MGCYLRQYASPPVVICAAEFRGLSPTLQMIDDEHVACMDLCDKGSCDELSLGSVPLVFSTAEHRDLRPNRPDLVGFYEFGQCLICIVRLRIP